jgi:hypothetical protein
VLHIVVSKEYFKLGTLAQVYNPSYWEAEIRRISDLRPARAKNSQDSISSNGWAMAGHTSVIPTMWGSTNRRIMVQVSPGQLGYKGRSYLKITNVKHKALK